MRILFLASDFPGPRQPTRGTFNHALAVALARRHDLRCINPIPWPVRLHGRPSAAESFPIRRPTYFYPPKIFRAGYHHWMTWSIRNAVAETIQNWRPDAILAYWAHPDGATGAAIAKQLGVPSAIIVGGSDVLLLPENSTRRQAVVNALQSTDAVVTVSRHLKSAVQILGIAPDKIHVWSQGVDTKIFHPGDKSAARAKLGIDTPDPVFVTVARLVPVKGIDILLNACHQSSQRGFKFKMFIVGDGPDRAFLEDQSRRLGLTQFVTFVGPRRAADLADWYRAADRTILSSRSEGLPNVLRESLACGTRFIATDVGGIRELAGPSDALVRPQNPEALADAMRSIAPDSTPPPHLPDWDKSAEELVRILSFEPATLTHA